MKQLISFLILLLPILTRAAYNENLPKPRLTHRHYCDFTPVYSWEYTEPVEDGTDGKIEFFQLILTQQDGTEPQPDPFKVFASESCVESDPPTEERVCHYAIEEDLKPFTEYVLHISACTADGSCSEPLDVPIHTSPSTAGPVDNLEVNQLAERTKFSINFTEPEMKNGKLDFYYALVYDGDELVSTIDLEKEVPTTKTVYCHSIFRQLDVVVVAINCLRQIDDECEQISGEKSQVKSIQPCGFTLGWFVGSLAGVLVGLAVVGLASKFGIDWYNRRKKIFEGIHIPGVDGPKRDAPVQQTSSLSIDQNSASTEPSMVPDYSNQDSIGTTQQFTISLNHAESSLTPANRTINQRINSYVSNNPIAFAEQFRKTSADKNMEVSRFSVQPAQLETSQIQIITNKNPYYTQLPNPFQKQARNTQQIEADSAAPSNSYIPLTQLRNRNSPQSINSGSTSGPNNQINQSTRLYPDLNPAQFNASSISTNPSSSLPGTNYIQTRSQPSSYISSDALLRRPMPEIN